MNIRITFTLIYSILTISIYAQEKRTYWDNGNLKSITNHNDGKKDGMWEDYFENGERKWYRSFDNGIKVGTSREYYFNGETKRVRQFNNGTLTKYMSYHINGRMMVTGLFDENGKKHGNWKQFYENGWPKLKGDYSHGEKQREWKFYNENRNIYKIENYNKGVNTSKWEVDINEGVELITRDVGDKLNGEWKFYNEKGKCIEKGNYKNDKKDGEWVYYHANGQLKKVQLWNEGKLMEVVSYFDSKGNSLDKGTLKKGNGTVKEYNTEGVITVTEYANGEVIDWNNSSKLNSMAWNVYEVESDTEKIINAIVWVKRSIELDKNYYNTDTYAALLYKIGNYKKALLIAQEAIEIAKKDDDDFSVTTKLIENIKSKLKR